MSDSKMRNGPDPEELARENQLLRTRVKNLEQRLGESRKSADHYRAIAEHNYNWEYWIGPDKSFNHVSSACERITGYPATAFYSDPELLLQIVHPHDRDKLLVHTNGLLEASDHEPIEFRILTADGSEKWISHTCCPVYDDRGEFLGRRGSNQDITRRKEYEQTLSHREALYRTIFEGTSSCVAVYEASPDGRDFVFKDFNQAAAESSQLGKDQVLGRSVQEVFPAVGQLGLLDVFRRVLRTGEPEHHPLSQYQDERIGLWVDNYVYKLPTGEIVAIYTDLTTEKLAEQKLRISEERLQLALEAASDAIWDWDVPSGKAYFSPRYFTMLGYEPDEMAHSFSTWEELVHPDDAERAKEVIAQHMELGEPYEVEFRLKTKDGRWHWVLGRGKVVEKDEQGRPKRMLGTHVDIDQRKYYESSLHQRLTELQSLNHLAEDIALSNSVQQVVDTSLQRLADSIRPDLALFYLLDENGEQMVLSGLRTDIHDFDKDLLERHAVGECLCGLAAKSNERVFSLNIHEDIRCTHPECKAAGIHSYMSLPLSNQQRVTGIIGLGYLETTDITKREDFLMSFAALVSTGLAKVQLYQRVIEHSEQLEKAVRHRTEQLTIFKNAVEHSLASVVITDVEGTITFVNPAFSAITGYSREEAIGQNPRLLRSGLHEPHFYAEMWRTISRGDSWRGEICNKKKGGELYWEYATISPVLDQDGKSSHYVAIKEDITERKMAEQELQQARQRAETADRAKSEFLATMSHEIRTPLNGVIGMTGLLLDTTLTQEQRQFAETVKSSAEVLLMIINDILDLSKIEAGRLRLERTKFSPGQMVEDVLEIAAGTAHEKGLELWSIFDDGLPELAWGDPTRFRQVLFNLVGNAVKFTERGEVGVHAVEQRHQSSCVWIRFEVHDTGIGISDNAVDDLFQPFTQAEPGTSRRYGGSGLGLTISKRLVEMMGGSIGVQSEAGKGSIFWFELPMDQAEKESPSASTEVENLSGKRVLIAEKNKGIRAGLANAIKKWGLMCEEVSSGTEAIEKLRRSSNEGRTTDFAIIDLSLPDRDGLSVARAIREDPDIGPIKLVALLGFSSSWAQGSHLEQHFDGSLTKPIRRESLLGCLQDQMAPVAGESYKDRRHETGQDARSTERARVLVAEDHPVNQQLAIHLLAKMGHWVDVAANGREAVEAVRHIAYDLVLMDCEMPEMDGFVATREIRGLGGRNAVIPIIAMTAHAMAGDRERCLAAGMDDYIAKPINTKDLADALQRQLQGRGEAATKNTSGTAVETKADSSLPVFDHDDLMVRLQGDHHMARELVQLFLDEKSGHISKIEAAVESQDFLTLYRLAHSFKGALSALSAKSAGMAAAALEQAAKQENAFQVRHYWRVLLEEHQRFVDALQHEGLLN